MTNITRLNLFGPLLAFMLSGYILSSQTNMNVLAFNKSIEKEKNMDFPGAIKCILDLNDSTSYEANLRLGWLYYKAGREKRSLACYQKAVDTRPAALEPRIGFAYPAYLLEDMSALIEQDKKILELDPNNKNINSNLGLIYYYNKDYAKALPYISKVVGMYPFDYDNVITLGWIYLRLDKNDEAEKYFNVALLYSPKDASAKEGLENIGRPTTGDPKLMDAFAKSYELAAAQNYKGAADALKKVYDPSSYIINLRLGWLSHLAKQEMEAVNYYKTAISINPNAIEAKLGCAIPTEAMGNKTELEALYKSILEKDPQNTYVSYKLGYLYYERKDYAAALPFFEKVYTLYPLDYSGLLMYAWTCYYIDRYEESRQLFTKVLCISPEDRSAKLGMSYKPVEEQKKLEHKEVLRPR